MWYGPYLVAVAELFPANSRGQAIGYTGSQIIEDKSHPFHSVFLLRLIGGNLPSLLVGPLKNSLGYAWALFILIPGMNITAAIIFVTISLLSFFEEILEDNKNKKIQDF